MSEVNRDQPDLGRYIRRGDGIVLGQACGEPTFLVEALAQQGEAIGDLSLFTGSSFSGLLTSSFARHVRVVSIGALSALRTLATSGHLRIVPGHYGRIPKLIEVRIAGTVRCERFARCARSCWRRTRSTARDCC